MMQKYQQKLAFLEQANAGMTDGRVISASEANEHKEAALAEAHGIIRDVLESGGEDATVLLSQTPAWARSLLDADLIRRLTEVAKSHERAPLPDKIFHEPKLGRIRHTHDEHLGGLLLFTLSVAQKPVEVTVMLEGAEVDEVLPSARALAEELDTLTPRVNEELLGFLTMINEGYLEEGQDAVTKEQFFRRAELAGITLGSEGDLTFAFSDDNMLWGHWMNVYRNPDGSWDASISG